MRCKWAEARGTGDAVKFISARRLQPLNILTLDVDAKMTPLMRSIVGSQFQGSGPSQKELPRQCSYPNSSANQYYTHDQATACERGDARLQQ